MAGFTAHRSPPPPPRPLLITIRFFFFLLALLSCFQDGGRIVSSQTTPVTDPIEANAVNSIFAKWNISAKMSNLTWNTTNDICSGVGLEGTGPVSSTFDSERFNPGIICDCRYESGSVCHVTRLKAMDLNISGRLPMEMMNLTYLNNLQIAKNCLTGPLPAFIGNLSNLEYISIGFNSFSGEIPKELGNLKKLKSLGMGLNNFTGPLPPELGNIFDLQQMYIDSIGVTGGLPPSFANFRKLKFLWAGDNNFDQKLPDFIGNISTLTSVRLRGNSFQGPIPSSFGNLVNLRELWLTDLSDESSSLSFIEKMPHLSTLVLRNSRLSGVIPSSSWAYVNFSYVDLSFNNLTGQIPQSLFYLSSLTNLFLGNNSLTGTLPTQKGNKLLKIDLSYNNLSGSLPSWTTEGNNLELNLVGNNFNSESDLPWGLDCLQKNTPCYRDSPAYFSFAINCGGNEVALPDGTIYEADGENLTAASYFVNKNIRWAVSMSGIYFEAPNPQYTQLSSSDFLKTSNQELFQSVRTSPSSLRYYGLALENGNYTITLKFAETAFRNTQSWLNFGRRIFDIYIQGIPVAKDFDIRKEAGERSFTAISRNYTALVSTNFLEIHLFWAGKGTCCIPTQGYYGPSISAISVTPNFVPTVPNHLPKKNNGAVPGIIAGSVAAFLLLLVLGFLILRWKRRQIPGNEGEALEGLSVEPNYFSFAELRTATDSFSPAKKLGEGGFGSVFKGTLSDGRSVGIKLLSETSLQGKKQFATEVATISAVQHRNLVKLYGCCYERTKKLLVYEYLENKSLDLALFEKGGLHLDWSARFDICLGTARGLAYLHEESSVRIVHRDIKASNILLDSDLQPKISDFGLAKLYDDKMTHISTRVAGTFGYLAPEYAMRGILTERVDIYGFGIVVLEILSGRQDGYSEGRKIPLLQWAWELHEKNRSLEMLDPSLSSFDEKGAIRMIQIAFLCTQTNPALRPAMSRVVAMLVGDAEVSTVYSRPAYLKEWEIDDTTTSSIELLTTGGSMATGQTSSSGEAWNSASSYSFSQGGR